MLMHLQLKHTGVLMNIRMLIPVRNTQIKVQAYIRVIYPYRDTVGLLRDMLQLLAVVKAPVAHSFASRDIAVNEQAGWKNI